jgi:YggT family protein
VRPDPFNPIVQLLYRLTNPAYALVRRYIPTVFNGVDLAPLVIIISLKIVQILIAAAISTLRTL